MLLLIIRFMLSRENKKRDAEPVSDDNFEEVYIEQVTADGKRIEVKVDKVRLDSSLANNQI
jgi:ACS family allantoate permease-like MFS transporter